MIRFEKPFLVYPPRKGMGMDTGTGTSVSVSNTSKMPTSRLFRVWVQIVFIWLDQKERKKDVNLARYTWELQTQYDPNGKPRLVKPSHKYWDETGMRPTVAMFFSQMTLSTIRNSNLVSNLELDSIQYSDLNKFLTKHLYYTMTHILDELVVVSTFSQRNMMYLRVR